MAGCDALNHFFERLTFSLGDIQGYNSHRFPYPSTKHVRNKSTTVVGTGSHSRYSAAFSHYGHGWLWSSLWMSMVILSFNLRISGSVALREPRLRATCPALPTWTSFEVATLLASSCGHVVKARSSVSWQHDTTSAGKQPAVRTRVFSRSWQRFQAEPHANVCNRSVNHKCHINLPRMRHTESW